MTKLEVAYEIYQWIKRHVGYTGYSNKSIDDEAYRELKMALELLHLFCCIQGSSDR